MKWIAGTPRRSTGRGRGLSAARIASLSSEVLTEARALDSIAKEARSFGNGRSADVVAVLEFAA